MVLFSYDSVGGQYRISKDRWLENLENFDPDYILVLSYGGFWEECNDLLQMGEDYLIYLKPEDIDYKNEEACIFKKSDIYLVPSP